MVPIRTNPAKRIDALVEHDRTPFRDRRNPAMEVPVGPMQALRCLVEREVGQGVARARGYIGAEELLDGAVVYPERSPFFEPKSFEGHNEPREIARRVRKIVLI